LPGDDLRHQIALEDVAFWGLPRFLLRHKAGQDIRGKQDLAQEERRSEEEKKYDRENRPNAKRDRVPPSPKRAGEKEGEKGEIKAGENGHAGSLSS
jgi:hypothetical protein